MYYIHVHVLVERVEDIAYSLYDIYGHVLAEEPLPQDSWNLQFL